MVRPTEHQQACASNTIFCFFLLLKTEQHLKYGCNNTCNVKLALLDLFITTQSIIILSILVGMYFRNNLFDAWIVKEDSNSSKHANDFAVATQSIVCVQGKKVCAQTRA